MKRKFAALLLAAILLVGCASPRDYFTDRRRDAADILTITIGAGSGFKGRAGPLTAGFLVARDVAGLRGGAVFPGDNLHFPESLAANMDICFTLAGWEHFGFRAGEGNIPHLRYKEFVASTIGGFNLVEIRGPDKVPVVSYIPYYTQIELAAGFSTSFRLGINPGELVDFLLGWFGIDIFRDDLEGRKDREVAKSFR